MSFNEYILAKALLKVNCWADDDRHVCRFCGAVVEHGLVVTLVVHKLQCAYRLAGEIVEEAEYST